MFTIESFRTRVKQEMKLVGTMQKYLFEKDNRLSLLKVNSVQDACAKCFAVHILKFEILQNKINEYS